MIITKKWTAITLAAILTAAHLAAPFSTVSALGAQAEPAQISAETSFEEVPEEESLETAAAAEDKPQQSGQDPDAMENENESSADADAEAAEVPDAAETDNESTATTDAEAAEVSDASETDNESTANADTDTEIAEKSESRSEESESPIDPEETASETKTEDASQYNSTDLPAGDTVSSPTDDNSRAEAENDIPEGTENGDTIPPARRSSVRRYTPSQDDVTDADNDDLFAAYVNLELDLKGSLQADTGDYEVSTPAQDSQYASRSLTGNDLHLYTLLLKEIRDVAAGKRANTEFSISLKDLGLDGKSWSASDLGVKSIVSGDTITDEAMNSLNDVVLDHLHEIWIALLADCPYDLYWHDKDIGISGGAGFETEWAGGAWRLKIIDPYFLSFTVSADYSATGETNTFEVDTSIGQSVQTARDTAQDIVDRYAGKTDYEKLDGYRAEICGLTSYDFDAAYGTDVHYGDPWQLIHVFDQDPATNVVCEGYSKSFQYLCDLSTFKDIFRECISVTGDMSGEPHMWNIVSLQDKRSYLVDITNCDEAIYDEEQGSSLDSTDLFLVGTGAASSAEVYAEGSPDNGYRFPALDNLTYLYDSYTRSLFDDAILTLAAGRVDASTTAGGSDPGAQIPETGVKLNRSTLTLKKGGTGQLKATVEPSNASDKSVTWKSDNPSVASVSEDGMVTAVTGGTATITAVTNHLGYRASCKVTVTEPVTDLYFEEDVILLRVGSSAKLPIQWAPTNATAPRLTWTSKDPSIVTVDQNGTAKAKKYGLVQITAKTSDGLTATCEVQTLFKDVYNQGKSYFYPVYWAVDNGITVCTVNFRPDDPVTRGEFVAFLWRLAGKPRSSAKLSFKDVNSSTKFYDAIRWAVGKGIIKGYSDGTFRPENNVTRGETATMIWRFDGQPSPTTKKCPFSDLKASSADSYKAILWGSENGIIKGSGGKFLKNNGCTRGQVVTFLYRYVDYYFR